MAGKTLDSAEPWSVGQLATATGVTVRTLHHYDHAGLVRPSQRTEAGHRRYSRADVERLYRVLALRQLGMGLEKIEQVLAADTPETLLATARQHLTRLDRKLDDLGNLREQVRHLVATLDRDTTPDADVLTDLLEAITMTVHLTKIYTRTGDDGQTSLGNGSRVAKTSAEIEALGDIDELNAALGVALATTPIPHLYAGWLRAIQNDLFDAGADLCIPGEDETGSRIRVDQTYVDRLEHHCDTVNESLKPLRSFVLPGGAPAAAHLHLCRTVCRRAERRALAVAGVSEHLTRYLNRLSDLLFILARAVDSRPADLWEPAANVPG